MRKQLGTLFGFALLAATWAGAATLTGCAAEKPRKAKPKYDWTRVDGTSESLATARDQCSKRATDATATLAHDRAATDVIINEFLKCMREKGWELDDADDHEDDD